MAWLGPVGSSCETKVGWCAAKGKKLKKNDLEGEANGCFFNGCVTSLCNLCLNICAGAWTVSLLLYFCHQQKVLKLSVNYSYKVSVLAHPVAGFVTQKYLVPGQGLFRRMPMCYVASSFCFRVFHPGLWILGHCQAACQAS